MPHEYEHKDDPRPIPDNDVIAVISGHDTLKAAVADLEREGFPREDIRIFRRGDDTEELEQAGKGGILAPIAAVAHNILSDESTYLEDYRREAERGAEVVAVHVKDKEQAELVTEILSSHHARNVKFFGKFAITEMTLPGDETTSE
jgi:hypothetical protein